MTTTSFRLSFAASLIVSVALSGVAQASSGELHTAAAPYDVAGVSHAILLGGKGNDLGEFATCDKEGACLLLGQTIGSFGDSIDYLAMRLDPSGKPLWARTYGGAGIEALQFAIPTSDGGFLFGGQSQSRFWDMVTYVNGRDLIMKMDRDGKLQWVKLMQNLGMDKDQTVTTFKAVDQTPDGGFILAGEFNMPPAKKGDYWPEDLAVLKIAPNGQPVWLHTYHFEDGARGGGVVVDAAGQIHIAVSYIDYGDAHSHPLLVTLNPDGTPASAVEYLGGGDEFWGPGLLEGPDNRLVGFWQIEAKENGRIAKEQGALLWIGQDGKLQDSKTYSVDGGYSLGKLQDGKTLTVDGGFALMHAAFSPLGLVLIGHTGTWSPVVRNQNGPEYDGIAAILDPQGNVKAAVRVGTQQRNPRHFGDSELWGFAPLDDGTVRLVGRTDAFGSGDTDFLTAIWKPGTVADPLVRPAPLELHELALPLPVMTNRDLGNVRDFGQGGRLDINDIKIGPTAAP